MAYLLPSLVNIVTHHDDGPALLWPLSRDNRFYSPINYWDHAHFGSQVGTFEWILDLSLVGYLVLQWSRSKILNNEL